MTTHPDTLYTVPRPPPYLEHLGAAMSDGRFQHLLQPIRDLSKNWNIDLATELEDYMDKLETLSIAFPPENGASIIGTTTSANVMNFAEAALLIQGTSAIYSRKVEYLHALVYQTLAHFSTQQDTTQERHSNGGLGHEQSDEINDANRDHFTPLPVYDTLEEAKPTHITLKRSPSTDATHEDDRALTRSKNNLQSAMALLASLVPDEREHGETFKLLSCPLHATGVLLLDDGSKKYLHSVPQPGPDPFVAFGEAPGRHRGEWTGANDATRVTRLNFEETDATDDIQQADASITDHHSDYDFDATAESPVNDMQIEAKPAPFATTAPRNSVIEKKSSGEPDPWHPLDAYDASASFARPFRKGRSYPRVSVSTTRSNRERRDEDEDGLSDVAFLARFSSSFQGPPWASWVWTETVHENPLEKTCKRSFCNKLVLVKMCANLWQREAKWRRLMQRVDARATQSAQAMLLREDAREDEDKDDTTPWTLSTATARLDLAFQMDAANGNEDEDMGSDGGVEGAEWDDEDEMGPHVGPFAPASAESGDGGTYEEICRRHLATFMAGTEKYVRETDLSKKVTEWQEKLTPLLQQQDMRPSFDIHQYGHEILCRLKEEQQGTKKRSKKRHRDQDERTAVAFETLVEGKRPFEVCRLFLASLQLANSGHVALAHAQTVAEQETVPLELRLLRTNTGFEQLQV